MSTWNPRANDIFLQALERRLPAERQAYLDAACADDAPLRAEVEGLLAAGAQAGSFLESPAIAPQLAVTVERPLVERPGTQIGPYKLLEQIGEGGFGIVFMAEQQQPLRRKVALKVLKPGMDTRQVVARFEAERQALALMDHPNIAKVLDAGATDSGRPYFVMDLVKGISITEYCDQNQLTPRERLELFAQVCQAIQHAHQKGIIHRDIKPSNVLVTLNDGAPLVKVIDFGIAKALGQHLTDKTLFTGFAQMIGTPLYMSPEQAALSNADVDTRSDIYSLGVLLYELLTGTTPFDKERLKSAAFDEIRRIIREDEPPKPSTRLSDLGRSGHPNGKSKVGRAEKTTSLASIAALRKTEPRKLSQLIRGDLDWIVMKALEKDRNRRYETAVGLAADVQRYLADEPVSACPPSAAYRMRKFVRRNRRPVLAATLLLMALLIGMAGTTIGLVQAQAERDKVLKAQDNERQALVEAEENFQTARDAVDRMYTRAAEEMSDKPQVEQIRRALLEDALRFYRQFLKRKSDDPAIRFESALSQRRVGEIYGFLGDVAKSLENHQQAATALTALAPHYANGAAFRDELARAHFHTGYALLDLLQFDQSEDSMRQAIALWEALTTEFPDKPSYLENLARANLALGQTWQRNQPSKGEPYLSRGQAVLAELRQKFPSHEIGEGFKFDLKGIVAWRYTSLPHDEATLRQLEKECRKQLAVAEAEASKYPGAPKYQVEVSAWLWRLGNVLAALDERDELLQVRLRTLGIREKLANQHPDSPEYQRAVAWGHNDVGQLLYEAQRPDEALGHLRTAIKLAGELADKYPEHLRPLQHLTEMIRFCAAPQLRDPPRVLELSQRMRAKVGDSVLEDLAVAQIDAGQYREALESCEMFSRAVGQTALVAYVKAVAYWHLGRQAEARELARHAILELGTQTNQYWYAPECRRRSLEMAKLMGLESEELKIGKASVPEALARYSRAIEFAPQDAARWIQRGQTYRNLGDYEKALADFSKAIELEPNNASPWRERGWTYRESGQYDKAFADSNKAIELDPKHLPAWINRAAAHRALKQYDEALADGAKAIELEPNNTWPWQDRSWTYNELGEHDKALADLTKAIELDPQQISAFTVRAGTYVALGQHDKAIVDYSKAIALQPDNASTWQSRSSGFWEAGQHESALADATKAVEILRARTLSDRSSSRDYWDLGADLEWLARLLNARGRSQEAERSYRDANAIWQKLTSDSDSEDHRFHLGVNYDLLGGFLRQHGRSDEAVESYRAARAIWEKLVEEFNHEDRRAHLAFTNEALGDLADAAGRVDEAAAAYREAAGVWEKLATDFSQQSQYPSHRLNALANLYVKHGRLAEADQTLTKAVERWPEHAAAWRNHADLLVRLALWTEAAEAYAQIYELEEPADPMGFFLQALLRRYADDEAGYEKTCRRMVQRFEGVSDGETAHLIGAVLEMDPEPAIDPALMVSSLERAVADNSLPWRVARLGLAYYRVGRYQQAVSAFEKSLAIRRDWAPAWVNSCLAMARHRLGNADQARSALNEARDAIDSRLDNMLHHDVGFLPQVWWDIVQSDFLYREARMLIEGSPPRDDPRSLVLRGRALEAIGRTDEARAAFAPAFALSPDDLMIRIQALPNVNRADRYAQALADLRAFLKEHPQQPLAARLALAQRDLQWGGPRASAGQFQAAADAFAEAAAGFEAVIAALAANADSATASVPATAKDIAWYRHELGYVLTYEGEALRKLGRLPEAEAALTRGLQVHESLANDAEAPADSKVRLAWTKTELAMVFQARGLPREAEQKYLEVIALFEGQDKAAYSLGGGYEALAQLCEAEGRTAEAMEAQRKAIAAWEQLAGETHEPQYRFRQAWANERLAALLVRAKESAAAQEAYNKAVDVLEAFVREQPDHANHYFNCGLLRSAFASELSTASNCDSAQKEFHEAIAAYTKVIELAPNNALAQNNLAWLYATCPETELRDPAKAVALAKRAVELRPTDGTGWNTLGAAQYRAGDWQAAVDSLTKSMELRSGGDAEDWYFLAMSHCRLGNVDDARKWHQQAVEWVEKNGPLLAGNRQVADELRRFRAEARELLGGETSMNP